MTAVQGLSALFYKMFLGIQLQTVRKSSLRLIPCVSGAHSLCGVDLYFLNNNFLSLQQYKNVVYYIWAPLKTRFE